jgi:CheY-like chemotaxis protein
MEQIISDFTRLASDQPAPKEKVRLSAHAREAQRLFLLANPDTTRLQLDLDVVFDVEVQGNGRLLEQMILNLLNNARDAMSGRGRIKLLVTRDGGRPAVYVADWGPGIPAELQDQVFKPYITMKSRGSGLGLAVCRRIALEHQAQISLAPPSVLMESPAPATVFRVVFPSDAPGSADLLARKRILVVDDETIVRSVFKDLMGRECEVIDAETAEDAIAHLQLGGFDLIISDKNLPGLSGLDLAQEARKLDPESRIILMTGYPSVVTAQQAVELGVMDYLIKPFDDIREVRQKIRSALATPPPKRFAPANRRVDVYEDNPAAARQISDALHLLGMMPNVILEPKAGSQEVPAGVVMSWDFNPAHGTKAVDLAREVSKGAPFVILAEHLTMDSALASLRGGAAACLPKLLSDVKALSRELARALKITE